MRAAPVVAWEEKDPCLRRLLEIVAWAKEADEVVAMKEEKEEFQFCVISRVRQGLLFFVA